MAGKASHLKSTGEGLPARKFNHWLARPRGSKIKSQMVAETTPETIAGE